MTPAVVPGPQVRGAGTTVLLQGGGDLDDVVLGQGGLDDHLGGELHPGGLEPQVEDALPVEAAQAAVEVPDAGAEEQLADAGQDGVAQILVQRGHGAGGDAALEPVAHDEVVAFAQLLHEGGQGGEVVGVVGVSHDHEAAARGGDTADEGGAVAARRHRDDTCTRLACNVLGTVGAPVVGDDDLPHHPAGFEIAARLVDADLQRLRLIEAGHHDGEFDVGQRVLVDKWHSSGTSFRWAARAGLRCVWSGEV